MLIQGLCKALSIQPREEVLPVQRRTMDDVLTQTGNRQSKWYKISSFHVMN